MKKYMIILSAIAATAFASCSSEITPDAEELGQEIGFKAVAQKNMATKANGDTDDKLIWGTTFPLENTFKVWGFNSAAGDFSEIRSNDGSNFMSGVKIEYTKGRDNDRAEAWRNADAYYYWPYTGKIGFYAFAPSGITPATGTFEEFTVADYTISAANETTDFMYGYAEGENRTSALPLTFKHALSQIVFMIKTNADYTADGAKFEVNKVELKKIDLSGDFSFKKPATAKWSDNTTLEESYVYSAETAEAEVTQKIYDEAIVMIPQTFKTSDGKAKIEISYTLTQANSASQAGKVTVDLPSSTDGFLWKMGTRYIYTLNFNLNEITFAPEVTDWTVVTVDTIVVD